MIQVRSNNMGNFRQFGGFPDYVVITGTYVGNHAMTVTGNMFNLHAITNGNRVGVFYVPDPELPLKLAFHPGAIRFTDPDPASGRFYYDSFQLVIQKFDMACKSIKIKHIW